MSAENEIVSFYHSLSGNIEEDKKLLEPFKYSLQSSKKHAYKNITPILNYWLKISPDKLRQVDEIINIIYNMCILFDDIQDNTITREGIPVAHSIYGLANTINAANYGQIIGFEKVANLHPAATKIMCEELLDFYRGQGMDMYWKDNFICPTEKEYKIMAIKKTGWIVKLAIRLMQLFSTYEGDLMSIASNIALYRQIHDDYCNLRLDKDTKDYSFCDDVTEGKISFLVVYALTNYPDDRQIINILKQRTLNTEVKCYYVKLLENFGSFKYARGVLEELNKKMRNEIDHLGGNPLFLKFLNEFENKMPCV